MTRIYWGTGFFPGLLLLLLLLAVSCKSKIQYEAELPDTPERGTIHISCDESFKPAIDAQVQVYQALHPDAHIIVHYKAEAECFRDFLVDSIRMVIATRGFSESEREQIIDSLQVKPEKLLVARDLIAVIVNENSTDTLFSMQEIRDMLTGKFKENLIPVFDGTRATSTVRFMLDSVLRGDSLSENVVAANSSQEVIDYVMKVPEAVGFIGFSWIGNRDDSTQRTMRQRVRLAYVESTDSVNTYVQPSQRFIYTKTYPMVRDLVYVLKERHLGLAHAFAYFLQQSDKGQRIFKRSYLMPVIWPNYVRDVQLNEKINNQ